MSHSICTFVPINMGIYASIYMLTKHDEQSTNIEKKQCCYIKQGLNTCFNIPAYPIMLPLDICTSLIWESIEAYCCSPL
jgi:anaerobic ribonucleoside-triphosphate reductase